MHLQLAESRPASSKSDASGSDVQFIRNEQSKASGKSPVEVGAIVASSKSAIEENSQRIEFNQQSEAYKSGMKQPLQPVESKSASNATGQSKASGKSQAEAQSQTVIVTSSKSAMKENLQPSESNGQSKASIKLEIAKHLQPLDSKSVSNTPGKSDGIDVEFNPFLRIKSSKASGKSQLKVLTKTVGSRKSTVEEHLQPVVLKTSTKAPIKSETEVCLKNFESKPVSNSSGEFEIDVNPFMRKKILNGSDKSNAKIDSKTESSNGFELSQRETVQNGDNQR